jgi:hypothetical protein
VRLHRTLLLVVLAYVSLDLSTPMVPGAFVFEVEDSVESVQGHGGRRTTQVVMAPLPPRCPIPAFRPAVDFTRRPVRALEVESPDDARVASYLPRAALAPTSVPEDH